MTVIASDGSPFEPFETEILVIYGGERFDIVLNANQNIGNYWIRAKGLADCIKVE
jgi:FtsP/CotA-like multicopper oxidase with cupredoxin domain